MSPIERSLSLLQSARFCTLASRSRDGLVWASTINYVPAFSPVKIIWCSLRTARHSENIRQCPQFSGSIYRTDLQSVSPLGLDGAQFTGVAREITDDESEEIYEYFSKSNFPDEAIRAEYMPPLSDFIGNGNRRFYEIEIAEWWVLDIDQWLDTKQDQRIIVNLDSITDLIDQ